MHGTPRALDPRDLLQRIDPLLGRAGVTRLANITGLDRIGVPVVAAIRPNSQTLSVAAGKGLNIESSRASAAMEALELFQAEVACLHVVRAAYSSLVRERSVVSPEQLPMIRNGVFHPDVPLAWTSGVDLLCGEAALLPVDAVLMSAPSAPLGPFSRTSNGLASGAVYQEAVLSGLLEVVERDAIACHHALAEMRGHGMPRLRLESIRELKSIGDVLARLVDADLQVAVYDCTVDTQVPVYFAVLWDASARSIGLYHGGGAHLDPEVALGRALTEAIQSRALAIAGSRDDLFRRRVLALQLLDSRAALRRIQAQPETTVFCSARSVATPTFDGDIDLVLERLVAVGVERVMCVELTQPEFAEAVAVVRVAVPGLDGPGNTSGHPSPRADAYAAGFPA